MATSKTKNSWVKRFLKKAKDVTSSKMVLPQRGYYAVRDWTRKEKLISKKAHENTKKKYGVESVKGGIGKQAFAEMKAKEIHRLKKILKKQKEEAKN